MLNSSPDTIYKYGLDKPGRAFNLGAYGVLVAAVTVWIATRYFPLDSTPQTFPDFVGAVFTLSAAAGASGAYNFGNTPWMASSRLWTVISIVVSSACHLIFGDPSRALVSLVVGLGILRFTPEHASPTSLNRT